MTDLHIWEKYNLQHWVNGGKQMLLIISYDQSKVLEDCALSTNFISPIMWLWAILKSLIQILYKFREISSFREIDILLKDSVWESLWFIGFKMLLTMHTVPCPTLLEESSQAVLIHCVVFPPSLLCSLD